MGLMFKIAWRNIRRHIGKTVVIGSIIFIGALIMTIGNGIISGVDDGFQKNIVDSFSGHLVLVSDKQIEDSVLAIMNGQTVQPINNFKQIKNELVDVDIIKGILPAGVGYVWILNDSGQPIDQYILGIEFEKYYNFFNKNLEIVEGEFLAGDERGVLVDKKIREWLYDFCGYWVKPQNEALNLDNLTKDAKKNIKNLDIREELVFMGLSRKNSSLDILAEVKGVFKFKQLNSVLGFYSLVDIESLRECMGYFTAADVKSQVSQEEEALLSLNDDTLEGMFSSSFEDVSGTNNIVLSDDIFKVQEKVKEIQDLEDGVYNVVFVKLQPGVGLDDAITKIEKISKENGLGIRAIKWNKAIGLMGQLAMLMKSALFMFVAFIFFVAIIIIMNTLSMAAMERISEIGMMRAVGARKFLISKMFLAETFILAAMFGGLGVVVGAITIKILAGLNLTTTNEFLQIFYGGDTFNPLMGATDILLCVVQLVAVTVLAVIYPIIVARRITPLDAISRD